MLSPGTTYLLLRPALALGVLRDLWTIAVVEPQTAHLTSARVEIPDFHNRATLAEFLGLQTQKLNWWLQGFPIDKRYRHFAVAKRGKGHRQIAAPIAPIKEMQRRLATALTAAYRAPAHVHGFTLGRSPQTNAAVHVGQRWVFGIDLEDFFPTITERRVRGMFEAFPFEYSKELPSSLPGSAATATAFPRARRARRSFPTTSAGVWIASWRSWLSATAASTAATPTISSSPPTGLSSRRRLL